MTKYFVWVAGLRGPQPQIWDEKDKTADGKPIKTLSNGIKLAHDDIRDLKELAVDYPFEAKS